MAVTHVEIDYYMNVRHANFDPKPGVNEVTGLNGAGKTSLLSAIATMGGKRQVAWKPIHDGADEAKIVIDMDGVGEVPVRMVRTFRRQEDGSVTQTLVLEGPGGARFPKPQALLDAIVGEFSFDPLAILRMDAKELQDVLKSFVPNYDFIAAAREHEKAFNDRTDVNRRLKDARSQALGIVVPDGTPVEPIDESSLVDDLQRVGEHNASVEREIARRKASADAAVRKRADADSHEQQARDYRRLADEADKKAADLRTEADDLDIDLISAGDPPQPKDASNIRGQIEQARATNRNVEALRKRNAFNATAEALQKEADGLTAALADMAKAKAEAIKKAKMPVDGLGFDDAGVVLFNGQPLEQASQAEKIRVSVALAAALSPRLKVAIVKDGSLLDRNSWALLEKYAEEHGLQVFVETVDSSRPTAIVIEDGRVRDDALKVAAE